MITFGPVPSRRLGRSLGINNIPPKICTYSCVYCQVGRTARMETERRPFYGLGEILREVHASIEKAAEKAEPVDYLTFVPDGEPTLDENLGEEIELLRPLGIPIAVISNSSLIWRDDVREELASADWVSLKVDAVGEEAWRAVNRPHRTLNLQKILEGALEFARCFEGRLATETMLVQDMNDDESSVSQVADFLARLNPAVSYLSIPMRPPAEASVKPPGPEVVNRAYQQLAGAVERAEYLIGYEGNAFASTGDIEEDLLDITSVHPMRRDGVDELLRRAGADWSVVEALLERRLLVEVEHEGSLFYVRRFGKPTGRPS